MTKLLISPQELKLQLHQPNTVVFDVRHDLMDHRLGRQQYMQAHIPGAYFLDNEAELVGPMTGENGRHPLPGLAAFKSLMQQYGLNKDSFIIVYDASQSHMAARTWWLLRWAGFEQVMILDGGWQAWLAANGVTDNHLNLSSVPNSRSEISEATPQPELPTVKADAILSQLDQPKYILIDARSAERYRGEKEPIDPIAGRIPGAFNRPTSSNLTENGHFKSADLLQAEFNELLNGAKPESVVHYCGSGMTACHNMFSMELAGLKGSSIYPGSWSEWIADPTRPRDHDS